MGALLSLEADLFEAFAQVHHEGEAGVHREEVHVSGVLEVEVSVLVEDAHGDSANVS